mmetsp:Transcript_19818/g.48500  ORF Transcript_19818/g.48500 Transcript_19818/m.48500 type:complete len:401 (-) Transcript_19818:784-1986(-)
MLRVGIDKGIIGVIVGLDAGIHHLVEPKLGTFDVSQLGASINQSGVAHPVRLNVLLVHELEHLLRHLDLGFVSGLFPPLGVRVDEDGVGVRRWLHVGVLHFVEPSPCAIDIPDLGTRVHHGVDRVLGGLDGAVVQHRLENPLRRVDLLGVPPHLCALGVRVDQRVVGLHVRLHARLLHLAEQPTGTAGVAGVGAGVDRRRERDPVRRVPPPHLPQEALRLPRMARVVRRLGPLGVGVDHDAVGRRVRGPARPAHPLEVAARALEVPALGEGVDDGVEGHRVDLVPLRRHLLEGLRRRLRRRRRRLRVLRVLRALRAVVQLALPRVDSDDGLVGPLLRLHPGSLHLSEPVARAIGVVEAVPGLDEGVEGGLVGPDARRSHLAQDALRRPRRRLVPGPPRRH